MSIKEYFKDRKVLDEEGNLLTMYHASKDDFSSFDKDFILPVDYDYEFNGFWFSSNEETFPSIGNPNYKYEVYLNIKNPAPTNIVNEVVKQVNKDYENNRNNFNSKSRSTNDEVRYRLQELGYDGIHWSSKPNINLEEFF